MGYTIYPFVNLAEASYLHETWKNKQNIKDVVIITSGGLKNEVLPDIEKRRNDPSYHIKFIKAIVYCGNIQYH